MAMFPTLAPIRPSRLPLSAMRPRVARTPFCPMTHPARVVLAPGSPEARSATSYTLQQNGPGCDLAVFTGIGYNTPVEELDDGFGYK